MVARFSNIFITNSFGINPVSGGKPPADRSQVDVRIVFSREQTCLNGILYLFLVTISVRVVLSANETPVCVLYLTIQVTRNKTL